VGAGGAVVAVGSAACGGAGGSVGAGVAVAHAAKTMVIITNPNTIRLAKRFFLILFSCIDGYYKPTRIGYSCSKIIIYPISKIDKEYLGKN
jgi:hypothetical protein